MRWRSGVAAGWRVLHRVELVAGRRRPRGVVRSRIAAIVNMALVSAVVTFGAFVMVAPPHVSACSCGPFTDTEAYEFADVVFTGALVGIDTPAGDIVVSNDPERFVFDVDQVFKGRAQKRQSVVTAREGASCGLEISGSGPFVVFARLDDDGLTSGAVEGEVYSSLCSGTRPLADVPLPASFGTPSPPATATAGNEVSSPSASTPDASSGAGLWTAAIAGVLLLGAGSAVALHRQRRDRGSEPPTP
jgi:hypothetical protein